MDILLLNLERSTDVAVYQDVMALPSRLPMLGSRLPSTGRSERVHADRCGNGRYRSWGYNVASALIMPCSLIDRLEEREIVVFRAIFYDSKVA